MDLITADGSVDCQADPANQEAIVARLHYAEIVTALLSLRPGGDFVIKMFTFFEAETVCALYLLSRSFAEVHVFKPATSKEGNSEVYVICKNYASFPFLANCLVRTSLDHSPLTKSSTGSASP